MRPGLPANVGMGPWAFARAGFPTKMVTLYAYSMDPWRRPWSSAIIRIERKAAIASGGGKANDDGSQPSATLATSSHPLGACTPNQMGIGLAGAGLIDA